MTARIYLAGPILDREDNGVSWRDRVKAEYEWFEWEDPLDKYVAADGDWDAARIVREDLQMIDDSAGLLVKYGGERSFGTMMEIFYAAHVQGKPVVIWWDTEMDVSPWIEHHTVSVTRSLDNAVAALKVFFTTDLTPVNGEIPSMEATYADVEDIRATKEADETMLSQ